MAEASVSRAATRRDFSPLTRTLVFIIVGAFVWWYWNWASVVFFWIAPVCALQYIGDECLSFLRRRR